MTGRPKSDPKVGGYPIVIRLFEMADKMEWTNQRYAKEAGMPYRKLCRIRQGIQEPSLHDVIKLADVFGLRVDLRPLDMNIDD